MRKYDWPVQIGYDLSTGFVIIWVNYNIKDISLIGVRNISSHIKKSLNISSVSIKKGYKINMEHNIDKLKVVSEREFVWVLQII